MIIWNKYRCAITIDDIGYHGGRMLPQDMLQVCSWWMSTHTFILCCSWWSPLLQGPLRSALHGKGNLQPCPCISWTQEIKFHTSWTGRVKPRGRSCCGGGKVRRAILNKAHHVFLHCYLFKLPGLLWVFMLLNIIAGLSSKFVFGFDYLMLQMPCYRILNCTSFYKFLLLQFNTLGNRIQMKNPNPRNQYQYLLISDLCSDGLRFLWMPAFQLSTMQIYIPAPASSLENVDWRT